MKILNWFKFKKRKNSKKLSFLRIMKYARELKKNELSQGYMRYTK